MVGCRNLVNLIDARGLKCIRHSDGGVSEPWFMVNGSWLECIRHSDGGVSELKTTS